MGEEKITLVDGQPVYPEHKEINPATGQQRDYVVLSAEERAKGYVRPVRTSYIHVGPPPPTNLRDLTDEEKERYSDRNYVKYEEHGPDLYSAAVGRYWTQEQLDNKGCGQVTRMSRAIAETYARDPYFYGGTFCIGCGKHLPLEEFVWLDNPDQRVGS
jgi:hypothetical protein